jgi:Protein of unknown function (DUF1592)/Protein of unknown function (DUF1588)/Protein of unknown function (DUF1595)/Protein of unknown function (DUF1587)/Protein of unknown function (DUF1585)
MKRSLILSALFPWRRPLGLLATSTILLLPACSGEVGAEGTGPTDPSALGPSGTSGNSGPSAGTGSSPAPRPSVVIDESGKPVMVNDDGHVVDEDGKPVTDENGKPVTVPTTTPTTTSGGNPTPLPVGELKDCGTPGPRAVRRLTAAQYANTLRSIFSDPNVPTETVLSDAAVLGFNVDAQAAVVRDLEGELLMNYAESVADWAVQNGKTSAFTSCTEATDQCQREFVMNFGAKAHREPLTDARISAYLALFEAEASFDDGARAVISAMLQSPFTLYRRELGTQASDLFALGPYELASELSYWLTDAPPDAALYDAAANGRLSSTDDLLAEATRLLETPQARQSLARFLDGWLRLDKLGSKAKDESLLPLPAALRESMLQESRELFLNTFYEGGTLADLFSARYTYVDQSLAQLYGLGGGGQSAQRVDTTGTTRPAGLLGHAAFLTTHALSDNSSPVQRAKIVIERLLCGVLPPVPSNVDTTLDTKTDFATNRERYEEHRKNEACRTCHEVMDPIGFAFEHFDAFGRYRDQENGVDINATGSLSQLRSGAVALDGVDSLSEALAESPELQACFVRYLSYYTFGKEGWTEAVCNRDAVLRQAQADDFALKSVLLGIVQAPNFASRVQDP